MNYDTFNKIQTFWRSNIFPYLKQHVVINTFSDYITRFAHLPSGKWIKDHEKFNIVRVHMFIDPVKYLKHFEKKCVTFYTPPKVEEGSYKIIHQISPTLHVESTLWMWVEREEIQSYLSLVACLHKDSEYVKFLDVIDEFAMTGDTEKPITNGFGFSGSGK